MTKDIEWPPRLSPAAQELVEKSTAEFKNSVVELARRSQLARPNPDEEITEVDVRSALDELGFAISEASAGKQVRIKRSTYRRALLYLGTFSASLVVGLAVNYAVGARADQFASVTGLFVALLGLAAAAYGSLRVRSDRIAAKVHTITVSDMIASNAMRDALIMRGWGALERAMQEAFGEPFRSAPRNLNRLINEYANRANLTPSEVQEVRSILNLRNLIAHSPMEYPGDFDVKYYDALIKRHLEKVRSMRPE